MIAANNDRKVKWTPPKAKRCRVLKVKNTAAGMLMTFSIRDYLFSEDFDQELHSHSMREAYRKGRSLARFRERLLLCNVFDLGFFDKAIRDAPEMMNNVANDHPGSNSK